MRRLPDSPSWWSWIVAGSLLVVAVAFVVLGFGRESGAALRQIGWRAMPFVNPVVESEAQLGLTSNGFAEYQGECSECHLAYPAYFLPKKSWQSIMTSLEDHFGEDASLDAETTHVIANYLGDNAAEVTKKVGGMRFLRRWKKRVYLRITETPFFKSAHHELDPEYIRNNPEIRSFSQCDKCHEGTQVGYFDKDAIEIPRSSASLTANP